MFAFIEMLWYTYCMQFADCKTKEKQETTMKNCNTCNKDFPETVEYFYKTSYGLVNKCKSCYSEYSLNYYKTNRAVRLEQMKAYDKNNPEGQRRSTRKFKSLKRGVHYEDWTEQEVLNTYGSDCYICNKTIDFNAPRVGKGSDNSFWPDHVIPISRGGEDTIRNVRPCHRKCNEHKGKKTYDEYIKSLA